MWSVFCCGSNKYFGKKQKINMQAFQKKNFKTKSNYKSKILWEIFLSINTKRLSVNASIQLF